MPGEKEPFLARWSRLKQGQSAGEPAAKAVPASGGNAAGAGGEAAPPLPRPEDLTPESDFSVFMGPKVSEALRRAALKKLFGHPEINVADPFEPYSIDWNAGEAIPEELLARLKQGRAAVREPAEAPAARASGATAPQGRPDEAPEQEEEAKSDGDPGRQDA